MRIRFGYFLQISRLFSSDWMVVITPFNLAILAFDLKNPLFLLPRRFLADENSFRVHENSFRVDENCFLAHEKCFREHENSSRVHENSSSVDENSFRADEDGLIGHPNRTRVKNISLIFHEESGGSGFLPDAHEKGRIVRPIFSIRTCRQAQRECLSDTFDLVDNDL
jgi:hypothetical protein